MATTQKITPNLWFNGNAEEAVNYYTSIFRNSNIGTISRYGKEGFEFHGMPEGAPLTIQFSIEGQEFLALNSGPQFKFNEAISFIVNCEDQEEIDYYWDKLVQGGDVSAQMCGWLKDKFGVSWQIVPVQLSKLLSDPDTEKSSRVMNAVFSMKKLDINVLQQAYEG